MQGMGQQGQADWRQILQSIFRANPGIRPDVAAEAVTQAMPFMNMASKQEWLMAHNQYLQQQLQQRGQIAQGNQDIKLRGQDLQAATTQAKIEAGDRARGLTDDRIRDLAQMSDDRIRDLAGDRQDLLIQMQGMRDASREQAQERNIQFKSEEGDKNRGSREGIAADRNKAAGERNDANITSREQMLTEKLRSGLERTKLSMQGKMDIAQFSAKSKAELADRLEQGRMDRAEMSDDLKRDMQRLNAADRAKLLEQRGQQAQDLQSQKGEQASGRQERGIEATGERQDKSIKATGERQDKQIGAAAARQDKAIGAASVVKGAKDTLAATRADKALALRDPQVKADSASLTALTKNYRCGRGLQQHSQAQW